jgi:hypothetical protein
MSRNLNELYVHGFGFCTAHIICHRLYALLFIDWKN